jgi:hypothetical protein
MAANVLTKNYTFKPPNNQYNIIISKHNGPPSLGQAVCRRAVAVEDPLEYRTFNVVFVINKL